MPRKPILIRVLGLLGELRLPHMEPRGAIHVGTSGWHYRHWKGPFYPVEMRDAQALEQYVRHFNTVEVNNTFYQLPAAETLARWRDAVPSGFQFAVKGSRYISHMKKLKDAQEPLAKFLTRVEVLRERLGPVLFQLPPRWNVNVERLQAFLEALPDQHRFAMEFRDPSWFDDRVYEALAAHGVSFCIYDLQGEVSPREVTADFVYVRLHGPEGAYAGRYDKNTLAGWAGAVSTWSRQGRAVYCYFNNDQEGYAPANAMELAQMTGGKPPGERGVG